MRIAMVVPPYLDVPPRGYGGLELSVHALCVGLAQRGHEVVLFASGTSSIPGEVRSCFGAPTWPPHRNNEVAHLDFTFRSIAADPRGFDVIQVHSPYALPHLADAPAPGVYTLHHPRHEAASRLYRSFPGLAYIAISERQRQLEIRMPDVTVIHHGLLPADYPLGEGGGPFLFLGRLSRVKGCHHAVDAAVARGQELVVAGAPHDDLVGEERGYFERELADRLRRPGVRWVGEVGPAEKVPLLRNATALVFPIEWEEPFGLVVIEALLSGTPVVALARGAVPELIEPGKTGVVADSPEEMTDRLLEVRALDRALVRERAIARFGHLRMADDHVALYERLRHDRGMGAVA
jgi:glycosyltransferase involved in cell wall biosynthesis